jgi:fatty-acyl-CoA synthase
MQGLTMDYPLSIDMIVRQAELMHGDTEVATRLPDRSWRRLTYAELVRRAKQLGLALRKELGLSDGDRVATLCWNTHEHLEAYLGVPVAGLVTHTLNPRLHADDLTYIAAHGGARVLVADKVLWPVAESFCSRAGFKHLIAVGDGDVPEGAIDYEELIGTQSAPDLAPCDRDERSAAAMCYTSGTTGRPKGVVYSHRALVLHSLMLGLPHALGVGTTDIVLPVVPMFHANAWGLPAAAALLGAKLVLPGPSLDAPTLLDGLAGERVTLTAGVPTIWAGVLDALDARPGRWDLSALRLLVIGGSAAPRAMIAGFQERHGVHVLHAWGMTEMAPVGSTGAVTRREAALVAAELLSFQTTQGRPTPLVEIRARGGEGLVPWDGETMGELEVRGAAVAGSYYNAPDGAGRWTEDGWFRTGDVVTIDPSGVLSIKDREKDLVRSGGEWISSVELENALMAHPAVAEAAVIAVPDDRWGERPLAVIVARPETTVTGEELRAHLAPHFAKWWLPDRFELVDEIPKTAVGKFRKTALRERFANPT